MVEILANQKQELPARAMFFSRHIPNEEFLSKAFTKGHHIYYLFQLTNHVFLWIFIAFLIPYITIVFIFFFILALHILPSM
jgi:hypothetical protein